MGLYTKNKYHDTDDLIVKKNPNWRRILLSQHKYDMLLKMDLAEKCCDAVLRAETEKLKKKKKKRSSSLIGAFLSKVSGNDRIIARNSSKHSKSSDNMNVDEMAMLAEILYRSIR